MNWNEYTDFTAQTAQFPNLGITGLAYPLLKLVGEFGEFIEKCTGDPDNQTGIYKELGDILWYTVTIHRTLNADPAQTWANRIYPESAEKVNIYIGRFYEIVGKSERKGVGRYAELNGLLPQLWGAFTFAQGAYAALYPNTAWPHIAAVAAANMTKLNRRLAAGTIKGDGDDR